MRFKLDANLGSRGAEYLHGRGHDVLTARDQGLASAPDHALLTVCAKESRALVTLDTDFANPIHYPPASHAGVVVLRMPVRFTPAEVEACLGAFLGAVGATPLRSRLIVVDHPGRVREYRPFEG